MDSLRSALAVLVAVCAAVFVAAWLLGAVYFGARRGSGVRDLVRDLRGTLPRRLALIAGAGVLALVVRRTPGSWWHHLEFWQPEPALLGAALAVASTVWLVWARWVLGTMWASIPMVREHHELRTDGPYRIVRHPIYTGMLGLVTGAMAASGFGVWVLVLAVTVPWLLRRVRIEDGLMADRFGPSYEAYRARVPALIPSLRPPRGIPRRADGHGPTT
ncbi:isoprenylcysteine carboxylmethyltransferase family protein [Streptomyces sp. NPDC048324]|uniref:methyltransferase family protein n=1 Tax=Streptomyces sp. NPDC048324 TaxID=3157205 RepID=UPI0034315C61